MRLFFINSALLKRTVAIDVLDIRDSDGFFGVGVVDLLNYKRVCKRLAPVRIQECITIDSNNNIYIIKFDLTLVNMGLKKIYVYITKTNYTHRHNSITGAHKHGKRTAQGIQNSA
jgi:hypothetical protein